MATTTGSFEWTDISGSYARQREMAGFCRSKSRAKTVRLQAKVRKLGEIQASFRGARLRANPVSRDSPMCNCTSEIRRFASPRNDDASISGLQLAKALPCLAVEAHELHLLDRNVIGR